MDFYKNYLVVLSFTGLFLVAACSSQSGAPVRMGAQTMAIPSMKPYGAMTKSGAKPFYVLPAQKQCVPHARELSGIPIRGNAYTWWEQADGKYKRGRIPKVGSVMVLSKTSQLRNGHLSVVKRVIDSRNIEVEHTNWGSSLEERCIVYTNMPVRDVSPNNDWSQARFWNYPTSTYGSVYKNSGFIYPPKNIAQN